ncbi:MAG: C25 family cysteine peptidase, partial [Candidatus Cloacimonetes bacterium]|nr:C25 family cysteine peptidase [Candidatus Cloacimonadota bacterium]
WIGIKLMLPLNTEASGIRISKSNAQTITLNKAIEPLQQQYPLSKAEIMPRTLPRESIYSADKSFPYADHNGLRTEFLAGHPIAFTAVCPFDYNPLRGELTFYRDITVEIETQVSSRATESASLLKQERFISDYLRRCVDNPDAVPSYLSRVQGYEYIIIIDQSKQSQWQPLKDFYDAKGYSVLLKPVQEITSVYPGSDDQQKIRNYLIDMFEQNSLKHVLLAADTDVIPHRGLYVSFSQGGQTDNDIPADMYYSCLDGTWNTDNDNYWGEMYEADLAPEFAIGRFCYNNDSDIANFINKVLMYHIAPVESEIKNALFVGEYLWDGPTWGGDYMDEMIGGSSMHGYTTVGVPNTWNIATLYDRTYGYEEGWGGTQIRAQLSLGPNLVNHLGHSSTTYNMRLSNNQVTANNISNDGSNHNYSIYFTQGCYAGAFDNRDTSQGSYVGDSITEKFTSIANSAAGMISHSRYGWGMQGSTDGASQYLHRQYIDAIFGEQIFELGYTLVDSKIDNIPFITNDPVMYWVTYETNLIGDPAMMIWTDTPQQITAQLPVTWIVGSTQYQVSTNAPGARVIIKQGDNYFYDGVTDSAGLAVISLSEALTPGTYHMFINAANYYSYSTSFEVVASQMAYVVCNNVLPVDDDGLLHAGENFSLNIVLQNVGQVNQQSGGTLSISTNSPHISIFEGTVSFDSILAGETAQLNGIFSLGVNTGFEDGTRVPFIVTAQYDDASTNSTAYLTLNAPILNVQSYQNSHSGIILPGHSIGVNLVLKNSGSGIAFSPMMILMPEEPLITLSEYEIYFPQIMNDSEQTVTEAFSIQISPEMESGTYVNIPYYFCGENGSGEEGNFSFYVGVINYSFENEMDSWTSSAPNAGFTNQWHRSNARNNTDSGAYSMKFGGNGNANYANSAYGALVSPEMPLGLNSQLKFYHWMSAETHNTATGMAWDGGLVQKSINGGEWVQITPEGEYPYRIYNNPASPFAANTWVYSGTHSWQLATFLIPETQGTVRFRFLFGSDGYTSGEGWYIDDVRLEADYVSGDDQIQMPEKIELCNYPNPFNPTTTIRFSLPQSKNVSLEIFNLRGQKIKSLIDHQNYPAGNHDFTWTGIDDNGKPVSSGVYFYKMQVDKQVLTRKMLMMK